jgi:hypothetical protein
MTTERTSTKPSRHEVISGALHDWWTTADLAHPFTPDEVSSTVERYLDHYGYTTPTAAMPTCESSTATAGRAAGPCILREHHDGPVHMDASGSTWCTPHGWTAAVFTAFLALACLTGATAAATHGTWGWAVLGAIGTALFTRELNRDLSHRTPR